MVNRLALGLFLVTFVFMANQVQSQERSSQTSAASSPAGGTIAGNVADESGAVLPDVTVILLNTAAVRLEQSKTGPDGAFAFQNVAPGNYEVTTERAGFSAGNQLVTVSAGHITESLAIRLKVAGPGQQITVTAEVDSFRPEESSTATKTNIPLNEIPQGIGVANQTLIQSQQDIRFGDAAENISGVNRDVLAAGDLGSALTIRGLPLGVFSNYYRDGFAFDGTVPSDTTDVDRVEILKGPSSVLYGRAASGGLLDGQTATTHHYFLQHLQKQYPAVHFVSGTRYVENGRIANRGRLDLRHRFGATHRRKILRDDVAQGTADLLEYKRTLWKNPEYEQVKPVVASKLFVCVR
jgi:Carboxypeptidase regulatory-like domain/TonB-dependent Receptor Plug Domain